MPSTSHRKCQYRGEGCTGVAHAGHDQCAHCYFQHIRPALRAEKAEMKRRREIKRLQLSPENRKLINETDLWEPPEKSTILDAVIDVLVEQRVETAVSEAIDAGKSPEQFVGDLLFKTAMDDIPPPLPPRRKASEAPVPTPAPEKEEPITTEVPKAPKRNPANVTPLTAETKQEIVDAYVAGISVAEICHAYDVGTTRLYGVLRAANVPLRGAQGGWSFKEEFKEKHPMPITDHKAPAPALTSAAQNGVTAVDLPEWVVSYLIREPQTYTVAARSFNDAAAAVADMVDGDIEVISIAKVRS